MIIFRLPHRDINKAHFHSKSMHKIKFMRTLADYFIQAKDKYNKF